MSSCQSMLDLSERTWSDNSSCSGNPSYNCHSSCLGDSPYLRTMSRSYIETDSRSEPTESNFFSKTYICSDTSTRLDSSSCNEVVPYGYEPSQDGNYDLWEPGESDESDEQGKICAVEQGISPGETKTRGLVESEKTEKSEKKVQRESANKEKIGIRKSRELNYSAHSLDLYAPREPRDQEDFKETGELGKGLEEPKELGELREPVELERSEKQDKSGENQGKLVEYGDPRKNEEPRETEKPTDLKESSEQKKIKKVSKEQEEREEEEKLKEPETPRAQTETSKQLKPPNQEESREPLKIVKPVKPGPGLRSLNHSDSFVLNTTLRNFASPRRRLLLRPKDVKAKRQK